MGSVHRLNVTRQCRCSYFELGQPVVQRPVFDSRPRIFFPFFGSSVCVTVSLFYFTIHILWLWAGFNVFILLTRVAAPRGVAINVFKIPNIETGLICY